MRLRTVAGAHAGEIRDYSFAAGQAALTTGTAVRLEEAPRESPRLDPHPSVTVTPGAKPSRKRS